MIGLSYALRTRRVLALGFDSAPEGMSRRYDAESFRCHEEYRTEEYATHTDRQNSKLFAKINPTFAVSSNKEE